MAKRGKKSECWLTYLGVGTWAINWSFVSFALAGTWFGGESNAYCVAPVTAVIALCPVISLLVSHQRTR
jgi:hypothetical protein